jgi:hypothetical protein
MFYHVASVDIDQRFRETCIALKMEAVSSSETAGSIYQTKVTTY